MRCQLRGLQFGDAKQRTMNTLGCSPFSSTSSTALVSTCEVMRSIDVLSSSIGVLYLQSPMLAARSERMSWWIFNSKLHDNNAFRSTLD